MNKHIDTNRRMYIAFILEYNENAITLEALPTDTINDTKYKTMLNIKIVIETINDIFFDFIVFCNPFHYF